MAPYFCEHCYADNELRNEVQRRGERVALCPVCRSTNQLALSTTDVQLRSIFRALVRLHYSEWEYNGHLGGEHLQTLLFGTNEVFDLSAAADELEFEQAFMPLEEDWYPKGEHEIPLGGGYWDGGILVGIRERLEHKVELALDATLSREAADHGIQWQALIDAVKGDVAKTVALDARFFRARVGVKQRMKQRGASWADSFSYLAYRDDEIGAPPAERASSGRLNREGVPMLYMASSRDTAIAEVRPEPGHLITTAEFRTVRELRIADFANTDVRQFLSDARLEELRRIVSLGAVLNLPLIRELEDRYRATQLVSECVKASGFDGVSFRSSLGEGTNTAIFDVTAAEPVAETEQVFEVRSVEYRVQPCLTTPRSYEADDYDLIGTDLAATTFHGLARFR